MSSIDLNQQALSPFSIKQQPSYIPFTFPSPPASHSGSDAALDFDFDSSFTHCSPGGSDFDLATTPPDLVSTDLGFTTTASTPSSTHLISPKSSFSLTTNESFGFTGPVAPVVETDNDPLAAQALSDHHLQRYLHYKALAAQAEAAVCQADPLEALLSSYSMSTDDHNMLAYQPQPVSTGFFGVAQAAPSWETSNSFVGQAQAQAAAMHAQAQAHAQAHDVALARAQQSRQSMPALNYYVPSSRTAFDGIPQQVQPMWSRQSTSSTTSPPMPSTPVCHQASVAPIMVKSATSASLPSYATVPAPVQTRAHSEGEDELEDELIENVSTDIKPSVNGLPVVNLHGGGRGYVPGKTPVDPKKRHRCNICGRGFARAFNLKSHIQTHNPLRSKPYQCPHKECMRGFSRLHDLERHRQGIHSDGPLVDAKQQGVSPAIARAHVRMQKRAETGGLI